LFKLLVDENVPRSVVEWLKKKGYTVTNVFDTSLRGAKDPAIASFAVKQKLTLLTLDSDFARIHHTLNKGRLSVILVKVKPAVPSNIIDVLNGALPKLETKEVEGKLLIVSKKRIRIIA
jgi:predicted nuclease of predicted toxin-antitoxin system